MGPGCWLLGGSAWGFRGGVGAVDGRWSCREELCSWLRAVPAREAVPRGYRDEIGWCKKACVEKGSAACGALRLAERGCAVPFLLSLSCPVSTSSDSLSRPVSLFLRVITALRLLIKNTWGELAWGCACVAASLLLGAVLWGWCLLSGGARTSWHSDAVQPCMSA